MITNYDAQTAYDELEQEFTQLSSEWSHATKRLVDFEFDNDMSLGFTGYPKYSTAFYDDGTYRVAVYVDTVKIGAYTTIREAEEALALVFPIEAGSGTNDK